MCTRETIFKPIINADIRANWSPNVAILFLLVQSELTAVKVNADVCPPMNNTKLTIKTTVNAIRNGEVFLNEETV